jgi:hypothetical protein
MGLMDKARQTAEQARAGMLGERPAPTEDAGGGDADDGLLPPPPPSARAGAAINAFIERINPGLLADLIIHATAAQEKTNKALRDKGSLYRISEMYLTASIPPQVGFYIARLGDIDDPAPPAAELEKPPPTKKAGLAKPAAKKPAVAKQSAPRPAGP